MDTITGEDRTEMAPSSETSHLVGSNHSPNPGNTSYLNLTSNVLMVIVVGILIVVCFMNGVTLFSFHPIFMSVGWLIFMASAVNAVTPGDVATEWMPIRLRSTRHWVIQLLAGSLVLLGFIVIVTNKIINGSPHFVSVHAKLGLSAFVFMAATMLGGVGALYSLKLKQYLAPIYMKMLHAFAGLVTFTLGITAIVLGFFSNWWKFGDILRYSGIIMVILIALFTVLRPSLKIYFRLLERLQNVN